MKVIGVMVVVVCHGSVDVFVVVVVVFVAVITEVVFNSWTVNGSGSGGSFMGCGSNGSGHILSKVCYLVTSILSPPTLIHSGFMRG